MTAKQAPPEKKSKLQRWAGARAAEAIQAGYPPAIALLLVRGCKTTKQYHAKLSQWTGLCALTGAPLADNPADKKHPFAPVRQKDGTWVSALVHKVQGGISALVFRDLCRAVVRHADAPQKTTITPPPIAPVAAPPAIPRPIFTRTQPPHLTPHGPDHDATDDTLLGLQLPDLGEIPAALRSGSDAEHCARVYEWDKRTGAATAVEGAKRL